MGLLAIAFVSLFSLYVHKKKENHALKIKVLLLNKEKRRPKPWARLLPLNPSSGTSLTSKKNENIQDVVSTAAAAPKKEMPTEENAPTLSTEELALELNTRMGKIQTFDLPEMEKTIAIADEIISREPESYSAYKAKLITILTEEGKLGVEVDDSEINDLLENMASFDVNSEASARKEAALISSTNNEIDIIADRLDQLTNERLEVEAMLDATEADDPNFSALVARRQDLLFKEEDASARLSALQLAISDRTLPQEEYFNQDIVQIPFLRMMAKGDFNGVLENAETFIQQFPNSPIGYFYLIRSLEELGRKEEALDAISRSRLSGAAQSLLIEKLNLARPEDPTKYWEKLNF
ncbi:MAG: hypothetical protein ACXVLQ_15900 [Bacteriovorax sp.]